MLHPILTLVTLASLDLSVVSNADCRWEDSTLTCPSENLSDRDLDLLAEECVPWSEVDGLLSFDCSTAAFPPPSGSENCVGTASGQGHGNDHWWMGSCPCSKSSIGWCMTICGAPKGLMSYMCFQAPLPNAP